MNDVVSLIGIPDNNRAIVLSNTGRISEVEVSIPGTTQINTMIDKNVVPFRTVALGGSKPQDVDLGQPSVVINTICEADANRKALVQATELIKMLSIEDIDAPPSPESRVTIDDGYLKVVSYATETDSKNGGVYETNYSLRGS